MPKNKIIYRTTSGAGYIPEATNIDLYQKLRDRAYNTVNPTGYTKNNLLGFFNGENRVYGDPNTEGLWGLYTNQDSIIADSSQVPEDFPKGRALNNQEIEELNTKVKHNSLAKYAVKDIVIPSNSKEGAYELAYPNLPGYVPHLPLNINDIKQEAWPHSHQLGTFHQIKNKDNKGDYIIYKDIWDINPFKGKSTEDDPSWKKIINIGKKLQLDVSGDIIPFGKPFEIHGKKYYDENGNIKSKGGQLNVAKSWDDLSLEEQSQIMRTAIQNGIYNLNDIKTKYNEFAGGGELEEWKALNNIDYEVIPDTSFTIDKTGTGTIEYFNSKYPQGITYPNGYHKAHPMPGKDVILYNPKYNDYQDIRLDALHIMPKDATYDALNSLYRDAAKDSDVAYNAELRYKEDLNNYGKENIDSYQDYFNNEADGLLRNMFIEGTPEYITSRRYYPNKAQLKEWNSHLMPYINNIQSYLETGVRPSNILPEVIITPNKKSLGGPLIEAANI